MEKLLVKQSEIFPYKDLLRTRYVVKCSVREAVTREAVLSHNQSSKWCGSPFFMSQREIRESEVLFTYQHTKLLKIYSWYQYSAFSEEMG